MIIVRLYAGRIIGRSLGRPARLNVVNMSRKPVPPSLTAAFSYAQVTQNAEAGITSHMHAARRSDGVVARARQEIAYGIYIGWRTLVESYADQATYLADDRRLETLLTL
ncbi:MAG: hypothetical protein JWP59_513 [Massilia sp.]|nr:hypothetical protein [Massilia sp.]